MKYQLSFDRKLPSGAAALVLLTLTVGLAQYRADAQATAQPAGQAVPAQPNAKDKATDDAQFMTVADIIEIDDELRRQETPTELKEGETDRAENTRKELTEAGFTDRTLQDKIIAFQKTEHAAQSQLYDAYAKIVVISKQKAGTDAELASLLNEFRARMDDETEWHQTAVKTFSQEINLAQRPKLAVLLMSLGIGTDDRAIISQGAPISSLLGIISSILPNL